MASPSAADDASDDETRYQRAQAVATALVRASAPLAQRVRTSKDDPDFLAAFHANSRLHWIGAWRERFDQLFGERPPPPPLSRVEPGCSRVILHVDLDCFFASVAAAGRPALARVPLAVSWASGRGGDRGGGEISSANYLARAEGVRAGMWCNEARALCPRLTVVPYEFERYVDAGKAFYTCLLRLTPHVAPVSCDEAYCDVTALVRAVPTADDLDGGSAALARALRAQIFAATGGCAASVGIGPNRLLARLATSRAKPDGCVSLLCAEAGRAAIMAPLSVRDLPGVGRERAAKLDAMGVHTCAQLSAAAAAGASGALARALGANTAAQLGALARGDDPRPWPTAGGMTADGDAGPARASAAASGGGGLSSGRKSFGCQASWGVRFDDDDGVARFVRQLAAAVADKAAAQRACGRNLNVRVWQAKPPELARYGCKGSIGHGDCTMRSKAVTLRAPVADAAELAAHALRLVRALAVPAADVRGLGLQLGNLTALPSGATRAGGEGARAGRGGATPDRRADADASELGADALPLRAAQGALARLWAVAEDTPVRETAADAAAHRKRPRDETPPGTRARAPAAASPVTAYPIFGAAARGASAPTAVEALAEAGAPAGEALDLDALRKLPRFGGGGGGWERAGDYFAKKKGAQSAALNALGAADGHKGTFLKGVVLWVDGHTEPAREVLRDMLCAHGGTYVAGGNFGKAGVPLTHVVTHAVRMGSVESKLKRMALAAGGAGGRRAAYVRPQWLVDSVAAGRQLDTRAFLIEGTFDPRQQTLRLPARAEAAGAAPDAAREHEQLPAAEALGGDDEGGVEGADRASPAAADADGGDDSDWADAGGADGGGGGGGFGGGGFSQLALDLPPIQQLDEVTFRQLPLEAQRSLRQGYANRGEVLPPHLERALREQPTRPARAPSPPALPAPRARAAGPSAAAGSVRERDRHDDDDAACTAAEVALVEMGFPLERVLAALAATPSTARADERTQAALDWMAPDDEQPQPVAARVAAEQPAAQQLDSSGPEPGEVDSDFWSHMPESIRAELPELLLAARAHPQPACRASGVLDGLGAQSAAPSVPAVALTRRMDELKRQVYAWAATDARELEAVQTYAGVERLAELARGLAAAGELESVETLVRFATRVLGPLDHWREALLTWLDDVDDAVRGRYVAPLAQVRMARGDLRAGRAAQCEE